MRNFESLLVDQDLLAGCCGTSGTLTSVNSSWPMALIVYTSAEFIYQPAVSEKFNGLRTNSDGKRGDAGADEGILEQVRPSCADQRGRVRILVVVGRVSVVAAKYHGQSSVARSRTGRIHPELTPAS